MTRIFISYRTGDDNFAAVMVDHALSARFGADNVFRDSRHLGPGVDFEPELWRSIAASTVVVAVIGARWLTGTGATNLLDRPDDFVRRELETAFALRIPVVPVLLDAADAPGTADLPDTIAGLVRCQRMSVSARNAEKDIQALVDAVHRKYGDAPASRPGTVALVRPEAGPLSEPLTALVRRATARARVSTAVVEVSADGVRVVQPDAGRAVAMAGDLVRVLDDELGAERGIGKVRVALHYGDVAPDPAPTLDAVRRLIAEPALDGVLPATSGARMVLAVSDDFHRVAIRPGDPSVDKTAYTRIRSAIGDAWVRTPGFPGAGGLPPYEDPEPAGGNASAATIFNIGRARDVINGNKIVNRYGRKP